MTCLAHQGAIMQTPGCKGLTQQPGSTLCKAVMSMIGESQAVLQALDQQGVSIHGSQGRQRWRSPVVGPCLHITQLFSNNGWKRQRLFKTATIDKSCSSTMSTEPEVIFVWKLHVQSIMMLIMRGQHLHEGPDFPPRPYTR